jgi:hypothetical protein
MGLGAREGTGEKPGCREGSTTAGEGDPIADVNPGDGDANTAGTVQPVVAMRTAASEFTRTRCEGLRRWRVAEFMGALATSAPVGRCRSNLATGSDYHLFRAAAPPPANRLVRPGHISLTGRTSDPHARMLWER